MNEHATDIVTAYIELYNDREPTRLEEICTPTLRFQGEDVPRDAFQSGIETWLDAFPDLRLELHEVIPGDDRVAFRFTTRGTHEGAFMGIDPTHETVEITEIIIFSIERDRFDGLRFEWDELGFYEQLGELEHPAP